MITTVPITEFRKDLFRYADLVALEGYEVEVEKNGKRIFKVSRVEDTPQARAKRALAILKQLGGSMPNFKRDNEFFRGKKETKSMKHLGEW